MKLLLPKLSQEALLNGANMFIKPLSPGELLFKDYFNNLSALSTYQIGDKVHFLTMLEMECDYCKGKDSHCTDCNGTGKIYDVDKEYKAIIKDIKVVRVQDFDSLDMGEITATSRLFSKPFSDWYNKQYQNYDENPFVFLYTVERI